MSRLSRKEIHFLKEIILKKYTSGRQGALPNVTTLHPKAIPPMGKRWSAEQGAATRKLLPVRGSLLEAMWQEEAIQATMRQIVEATDNTDFYPHTYEDLNNPRFDARGMKDIAEPSLKVYLLYAGIASLEALRAQMPREPILTPILHLWRRWGAGFVAGILLSLLFYALLGALKKTPAPVLGECLSFHAYYIAADAEVAQDSFWDRATIRMWPLKGREGEYQVTANNLFRDSSRVFDGIATLEGNTLSLDLCDKGASRKKCFFMFDLGERQLQDLTARVIGGVFMGRSVSTKISNGAVLLLGDRYPAAERKQAEQTIKQYLKKLPNARLFADYFPLKGEIGELK